MLVESDRKPLESIFKKPVLSTLPRLQKFVLVFDKYDSQHVQVVYKPGKTMFLADHLSRSYLKETKEALVPNLQVSRIHLTSFLRRKYRIRRETSQDDELQPLLGTQSWMDGQTTKQT